MASKWQKLVGKYPTAPLGDMTQAGDKKFIEKVDERKFTYAELPLPQLMALHIGFSKEWDELQGRIKELNIEFEAVSQLIANQFAELNVNSMNSDLGQNFYLAIEPTTTVNDNDAWEQYVEERPELHYMWQIGWQQRNTLVKALLDEGKDSEIPPMLSVYLKKNVRSRKA